MSFLTLPDAFFTALRERRIPWHQRLQARVFLGILLIAVLALASMLFASRKIITDYSMRRAKDDLLAAKETFNRLTTDLSNNAAAKSQLITELPIFRACLSNPNV